MTLQSFTINGKTYRQQYRACGRKCGKCPKHGPYWFKEWWEEGRVKTEYVGKKLPDDVKPPSTRSAGAAAPKPLTLKEAFKVLGTDKNITTIKVWDVWNAMRKRLWAANPRDPYAIARCDEAYMVIFKQHDKHE